MLRPVLKGKQNLKKNVFRGAIVILTSNSTGLVFDSLR